MTRETITLTDDMLRAHKLARIAATVTITITPPDHAPVTPPPVAAHNLITAVALDHPAAITNAAHQLLLAINHKVETELPDVLAQATRRLPTIVLGDTAWELDEATTRRMLNNPAMLEQIRNGLPEEFKARFETEYVDKYR